MFQHGENQSTCRGLRLFNLGAEFEACFRGCTLATLSRKFLIESSSFGASLETRHPPHIFSHNNASRRGTMTVVGQPQVVYTYDKANRLTTITRGTSTVTIGYDDADGRTSVTYPNTNSITYGYNVASKLTSLTYKQEATVLGDLTYTCDAAGNRIKTSGGIRRESIEADSAYVGRAYFVTE